MITIANEDLARVSGGAQPATWDAYVRSQRQAVAPAYKNVVCTAAGVKGGKQFATEVYGANRTNGADMIRAAETLKSVCMGGDRLPDAAPQAPF